MKKFRLKIKKIRFRSPEDLIGRIFWNLEGTDRFQVTSIDTDYISYKYLSDNFVMFMRIDEYYGQFFLSGKFRLDS